MGGAKKGEGLAKARRMEAGGRCEKGLAEGWRLAGSKTPEPGGWGLEKAWMQVLQAAAVLSPCGGGETAPRKQARWVQHFIGC